jgi:hypothetical protein
MQVDGAPLHEVDSSSYRVGRVIIATAIAGFALTGCGQKAPSVPDEPLVECHITVVKKDKPYTYGFSPSASVDSDQNVKVVGYKYNFHDHTQPVFQRPGTELEHTYPRRDSFQLGVAVVAKLPNNTTVTRPCGHPSAIRARK